MADTITVVALAAAGAYALSKVGDEKRSTPPPDANKGAIQLGRALGAQVCGATAGVPVGAGPLGTFGAQLHALIGRYGQRRGLVRGGHLYPDKLPLDCALAWGEMWRGAFVPWLQGAIEDFGDAWVYAVTQGRYEAAERAHQSVHQRLLQLQILSGRIRAMPDQDGALPLSEAFRRAGMADMLLRPATDGLVDAIRILAAEMENVYDENVVFEGGQGYWSIAADAAASNIVRPAGDAIAAGLGAVGGVAFDALAQAAMSPLGAAAAGFLWWRYGR